MPGPSVSARLKAAEQAVAAGRLDEAHELLNATDLREHPRGAEVRGRLAEALLTRVRAHEEAGRYAEALQDLDRAAEAGARPEQVAALREWVRGVASREQNADRAHRRQVEAARDRIDAGSLMAGREILGDLDAADTQVQRLQREVEERERTAERLLTEARRLLEAGQFGPACRTLERARSENPRAAALLELEAQITRGALDQIRSATEAGRLDTAADLLGQLGDVGRNLPERSEWERTLAEVRSAIDAAGRADWEAAKRAVLRLKTRLPEAQWLSQAAEQLSQIDELVTAVLAGPLGVPLQPSEGRGRTQDTVVLPRANAERAVRPPRDHVVPERTHYIENAVAATGKWQLLVDGAGSFLVLCQDRVTIGRAGGGDAEADIALMADISGIHAEIARIEDDYFLFARKPLLVNGRTVSQRLLEDGDRIELSRHARLTFRLPSRRSASAVLELGGSQRLAGDVRRVVLFDRYATMGPGAGNHIVVPGAYGSAAVFERAGRLCVRPMGDHGPEQSSGQAVALVDGEPVEAAGIRMAIRVQS
jgi:tetratricopeptide (TPR) repeat protein